MKRFDPRTIPELAEQEANRLRYWFRQEYRLPPTDPRYQSITDEEILLEYELHLVAQGHQIKECPRCGIKTHRSTCPTCETDGAPLPLTGDTEMDDVISRIEAGEDIDLNELMKPGNFVPLPRE